MSPIIFSYCAVHGVYVVEFNAIMPNKIDSHTFLPRTRLGFFRLTMLLMAAVAVSGCSSLTEEADKLFTIGGIISGLKGTVALQNNAKETILISKDGSFNFKNEIEFGKPYEVTVSNNPTNPIQQCAVTNGKGTVGNSDITSIRVLCTTDTFAIGGSLTGLLAGSSIILRNNGKDDLKLTEAGSFVFKVSTSTPEGKVYDDHSEYDVTILSLPQTPKQTCLTHNAKGSINGKDVTDIEVVCADTTKPAVVHTIPIDQALGISRSVTSKIFFSEDIKADSLTDNSLTLDSAVGTVSYDSTTWSMSVQPNQHLQPLTQYTVNLATDNVTDPSGNSVAASPISWSFTTADGLWNTAVGIEQETNTATSPDIATDSANNKMAVWEQYDGSRFNIQASYYDASLSEPDWGMTTVIDSENTDAIKPRLVIDNSGNTVAIWEQSDGNYSGIWVNHYSAGSWQTALQIDTKNQGDAHTPQLVAASNDDIIAVWSQYDGLVYNIYTSRYTSGSGWQTTPDLLETVDTGHARLPQIAIDNNDNIYVVWQQTDGSRYNIQATRYDAATPGWQTPQLIETGDDGHAYDADIAIDPAGNVMVVWEQSDGLHFNIWANRYTVTSNNWETAVLLEVDNTGDAYNPKVDMDDNGHAIVVWQQYNGTNFNIYSNRFISGTGWATAQRVDNADKRNAIDPQIATDSNNNAIAVWTQFNDTDAIYQLTTSRYNTGPGWGTPEIISFANNGDAIKPILVSSPAASTSLIWSESDGSSYNIYFNQYTTAP